MDANQNATAGLLAMESVDSVLPSDVVEQSATQNDDIDSVLPMDANQNATAGLLAMDPLTLCYHRMSSSSRQHRMTISVF